VRHVLLIAVLLLGVRPAMGQSLCTEPVMPIPLDGAAATADQMRAAMADARNFIAQSGVFQDCLTKEVEDAKSQAVTAGQAFESSIEAGARARMDANKKQQERVGATLDGAMLAYKNAHPN
jgi:hypothetical protein